MYIYQCVKSSLNFKHLFKKRTEGHKMFWYVYIKSEGIRNTFPHDKK